MSLASDFSLVMPWKALRRCNADDDGSILAFCGGVGYDDTGANGLVMDYVPLFYYTFTDDTLITSNQTVANDEFTITVADAGLFAGFAGNYRPIKISDSGAYEINAIDSIAGNVITTVYPMQNEYSSGTVAGAGGTQTISNNAADGLPPHPMFVKNGDTEHPKPYLLLGAFPANLNANTGMLESRGSTADNHIQPVTGTCKDLGLYATARNGVPSETLPLNVLPDNAANGCETGAAYPYFGFAFGGSGPVYPSASTFAVADVWPVQGNYSVMFTSATPATAHNGLAYDMWGQNPVHPETGKAYTFSFIAYAPDNPGIEMSVGVIDYDSDGNYLDWQASPEFQVTATPTRFAFTFTPEVDVTGQIHLWVNTASPVAGAIVYFDCFQLEEFPDGYSYPDNLPPGYSSIAPGGAPSEWHMGTLPPDYKRPVDGWGIETYAAHSGVQLLAVMEFGVYPTFVQPPPGYDLGLTQDCLGSSPSATLLPYNGYTGSFGVNHGNNTGTTYAPLLEAYATTPTAGRWPNVNSYRGFESLWHILPYLVDGAAFYLDTNGYPKLRVSDSGYTWDGTYQSNYVDGGITMEIVPYDGIVDEWAIGSPVNWAFLPKSGGANGNSQVSWQFSSLAAILYPTPVLVGVGNLLGVYIGYPQNLSSMITRIQFTPA